MARTVTCLWGRRKVGLSLRTPTLDGGLRDQNTQLLVALDGTFCQRGTLLETATAAGRTDDRISGLS